jgi:hypothetical protein
VQSQNLHADARARSETPPWIWFVYGDGDVGITCFLHESENRVRSR